jgi:hypothetical protein
MLKWKLTSVVQDNFQVGCYCHSGVINSWRVITPGKKNKYDDYFIYIIYIRHTNAISLQYKCLIYLPDGKFHGS